MRTLELIMFWLLVVLAMLTWGLAWLADLLRDIWLAR